MPRRVALALIASVGATSAAGAYGIPALELPDVYFAAAYGFLARSADVSTTFPYLSAFLDEANHARGQSLSQSLDEAARRSSFSGMTLRVDELAQLGPGKDSRVLALAFDNETVTAEQIGQTWKLLVELSFQALIFDFRSQTVIGSFPFTVQYIDALTSLPDAAAINGVLQHLVFGDQPTGLQAVFWNALTTATLPHQGARTLAVTEVTVSEPAQATLAELGVSATTLDMLGHDFGKFFVANQHVAILPYTGSQAVNGVMAEYVSNGTVYNLKVPAPDYAISLRLDGLKKIQFAATTAGAVWVYGAFFTIRFFEPLSQHEFFNAQVKMGANLTVPSSLGAVQDWPSYEEVIEQLFDEFTVAISPADEAWGLKHLVTSDPIRPRMAPLKDLIDSCR